MGRVVINLDFEDFSGTKEIQIFSYISPSICWLVHKLATALVKLVARGKQMEQLYSPNKFFRVLFLVKYFSAL